MLDEGRAHFRLLERLPVDVEGGSLQFVDVHDGILVVFATVDDIEGVVNSGRDRTNGKADLRLGDGDWKLSRDVRSAPVAFGVEPGASVLDLTDKNCCGGLRGVFVKEADMVAELSSSSLRGIQVVSSAEVVNLSTGVSNKLSQDMRFGSAVAVGHSVLSGLSECVEIIEVGVVDEEQQ